MNTFAKALTAVAALVVVSGTLASTSASAYEYGNNGYNNDSPSYGYDHSYGHDDGYSSHDRYDQQDYGHYYGHRRW